MNKLYQQLGIITILGASLLSACSKEYDDSGLKGRIDKVEGRTNSVENRLLQVENHIKEINTNISGLRNLITALEKNLSIRSIVPTEGARGYSINLSDGTSFVIYHGERGVQGERGLQGLQGERGQDAIIPRFKIEEDYWHISYNNGSTWERLGKAKGDPGEQGIRGIQGERGIPGERGARGEQGMAGVNGQDGTPGRTPIIGVRQQGQRYYWTIDGEWLRDSQGVMVPASPETNTTGTTSPATGVAGRDGITPKLRIENDQWQVSYNNGATWETLGRAKGDKGERGEAGAHGAAGQRGETGAQGPQGQRGERGLQGESPIFKIENDYWYISYNGGTSWTQLGRAKGDKGERGETGPQGQRGERGETGPQGQRGERGEAGPQGPSGRDSSNSSASPGTSVEGGNIFQSIIEDDHALHITLSSGVTLNIPKTGGISINFTGGNALGVNPNSNYEVSYTLSGQIGERTRVYTVGQGGYTAKVQKSNQNSGRILIKTPEHIQEGRILVFVSNDKGQTIMSELIVDLPGSTNLGGASEGVSSGSSNSTSTSNVLRISTASYSVAQAGGNVQIELHTNTEYRVSVDREAESWVHIDKDELRSTLRRELINLRVDANETGLARRTTVLITNHSGSLQESITIQQGGGETTRTYHVATPGELEDLVLPTEHNVLREIKITGRLNAFDYDFLRSLTQLVKIDLSELEDTAMPPSSFSGMQAQAEVILPQGLTAIPDRLFYNSKLTKLNIPAGVTRIGVSAFEGTSSLRGNLLIPNKVVSIGERAFYQSKFDGSLVLGEKVQSIGAYSFYQTKFSSITFGQQLLSIRESAFSGLSSVRGDLILPNSLANLGSSAFQDSGFTDGKLVIGNSLKVIPQNAFSSCGFNSLEIGENVTDIHNDAFNDCAQITGKLVIPDKVKTIGERAFSACSKISGRLVIGASVTSIGNGAFYFENITSMKIYCKAPNPPSISNSYIIEKANYGYSNWRHSHYSPFSRIAQDITHSSSRSYNNPRLSYLAVPTGSKTKYERQGNWFRNSSSNSNSYQEFSIALIEEVDL